MKDQFEVWRFNFPEQSEHPVTGDAGAAQRHPGPAAGHLAAGGAGLAHLISNLLRGRLDGFSTDRLFRFLTALDRNVEIVIRPKAASGDPASIRVFAMA